MVTFRYENDIDRLGFLLHSGEQTCDIMYYPYQSCKTHAGFGKFDKPDLRELWSKAI